jgi:hypothetical protein
MNVKKAVIYIVAVILLIFTGNKVLSARAEGLNAAQGAAICVVPKKWGSFKGATPFPVFENSAGVIRIVQCRSTESTPRVEREIHRQ